jgi:peroxiredoxin
MSNDEPSSRLHRRFSAGDLAPEFRFADPTGKPIRSSALLAQGPVLMTFYRGAWCPCCQADLRNLADATPGLLRMRTTVLGVFHGLSREAGLRISREYGLSFPLVDDVDGAAAEAFGIRRSAMEIARMESELGPTPRLLQEGEPWIMPMQARYVIRADGVIASSEVVFDYHERTDATRLIPILEALL